MGLMLIWRPSNPRAEKAFYNIIVIKSEVLYKAIFIDKSFTAITAVTQKSGSSRPGMKKIGSVRVARMPTPGLNWLRIQK